MFFNASRSSKASSANDSSSHFSYNKNITDPSNSSDITASSSSSTKRQTPNLLQSGLNWLFQNTNNYVECTPAVQPGAMTPASALLDGAPGGGQMTMEQQEQAMANMSAQAPVMPPDMAAQKYLADVLAGQRPNPGTFEDADQEAKIVTSLDCFDGVRFIVQRNLSPTFSFDHFFWLGSNLIEQRFPGGNLYQFGTLCQVDNKTLRGTLDHSGRLEARYVHELGQNAAVETKVSMGAEGEGVQCEGNLILSGKDWTGNVKAMSGPVVGATYFQSVSPYFAFGGDSLYHTERCQAYLFFRGRYKNPETKVSATATVSSVGSVSASYSKRIDEKLVLATDCEISLGSKESSFQFGYQYTLRQAQICGVIDNNGMLKTTVKHMVHPGMQLIFSAALDHTKDSHRFGYGVQLM